MRDIVNTYAEKFLHDRKERLKLIGIIAALAVLVVLGVFWRLHYTGVAMTNEVYCGVEEHTHDESCYEEVLVCGLEECDPVEGHTHSDACYETVTTLICGQDETLGHYHTEACYETIPAQLICGQEEYPGHYHDAGCYDEEGNLICGSDEYEGHTHTEACWSAEQRNLICGQDEYEGHTHTDACYQTDTVLVCGMEESAPVEGHTHTEDCYEKQLVCDLEEHTHTIECMTDENADLETAEVWEATLPKGLTGIWAQDVVTVAQSQVGYEESTKNFILDEDQETRKGYTRYGAWYGNEYGDWDAMFASFCLHYAGVPEEEFPQASGSYAWTIELAEKELYENAEDYEPLAGDLVFLDKDGDGLAECVGIAESVKTQTGDDGEEIIEEISVIEGNCEDKVKRNRYGIADSIISGYGKLPEQPGLKSKTETETETETGTSDPTGAITLSDEHGLNITISTSEVDQSGNDGLYTGETVNVIFTAENSSDSAYSEEVLRFYLWFEGDDYTFPYKDGENVVLHTSATDPGGVTTEVTVTLGIHYLGDGLWCLEIDGNDIVPGLTLDDIIPIYYANGTSGGTMTVFAEFITKPEVGDDEEPDYQPSQPIDEYETIIHTWQTEPGTFSLEKTASQSGLKVYGGENNEYFISGLTYTITPSITTNSMNDAYGSDHVETVSYDDVLILDEGTEWIRGLIDAVENENYRVASISSNSYQEIYITIGEGDESEEYLLCSIFVADATSSTSITIKPYVDADGNLCLHWETRNSSTNAATIRPSYFTLTYGDDLIMVSEAENLKEDTAFIFDNSASAIADMRDSDDQTDDGAAQVEVDAAEGSVKVTKSTNATNGITMGVETDFTIIVENPGSLPYYDLRYIQDTMTDWLYLKPEAMQALFDSDDTHSLVITISPAALCTPTNQEDYAYDYGPETTDRTVITENAEITFSWLEPENEENSMLQMTVDGTNYTIGEGGIYETIESALDKIGYVVTQSVTYSLLWDLGEEYVLYGGDSINIAYKATVKDSFMRLTADQESYLISDSTLGRASANTVYAQDLDQETLDSASASFPQLYRDFTLYKYDTVYRNEEEITDDTLTAGDVIQYKAEVSHRGAASYKNLPFEDQMSNGLILLAPVSLNSSMTLPDDVSSEDLRIVTFDGVAYYVLDQAGTYENVVFATDAENSTGDTQYTAKVVVSSEGTMIYSSMDVDRGNNNLADFYSIYYYAMVGTAERGADGNISYSLENYVYLNDHETHRLYDHATTAGMSFNIEKTIVTEKGTTCEEDELEKSSVIYEGDAVTYRFSLINYSNEEMFVLKGSQIYDTLPQTMESLPWTEERILDITFALGEDAGLCDENGNPLSEEEAAAVFEAWQTVGNENESGWYVDGGKTTYYLRWTDDLILRYTGTVYVYVTVQYPDGEEWKEFAETYHDSEITNTVYAYGLTDKADHTPGLKATTTAWLQKGVYDSGYYWMINDDGSSAYGASYQRTDNDGLWYYTNNTGIASIALSAHAGGDHVYKGFVEYYTAVYNTGDHNLYLNEIQDVLPEGFTLISGKTSNYYIIRDPACTTGITLTDSEGSSANCVTFALDYETVTNDDGRQVITFDLYAENSSTLKYDEIREKYYLAPGEAAVITYFVTTGAYENSEDAALNVVAMPNYSEDYDGGGVTKYDGSVAASWRDSYGRSHNDGTCDLLDDDNEAAGMGMTVSEESNMWLSSGVTVHRGSIVPGITKSAGQAAANNNDTLDWTVTVYNDGTGAMEDYTITEVMQAPYAFTGSISYIVYSGDDYSYTSSTDTYKEEYTMGQITLTFGSSGSDEGGDYVNIRCRQGSGTSNSNVKVYLDGTPTSFTVFYGGDGDSKAKVNITMTLYEDESGNAVMTLHFTDSASAILPGGYGVLTLQTNNPSSDEYNSTFYNTAYITPTQSFDSYEVTKGAYVNGETNEYVDGNSVRATASTYVSFGHATTAQKSVTELDESGNSTDNRASSDATSYSDTYITLADEGSTFRYILEITNGDADNSTDYAMNRLVVIDNLPEEGDYYTSNDVTERGSAFKVDLAADPNFVVALDGIILTEGTDYRIEYSDKENYFTSDDWLGIVSSDWYDTPTEFTRSFRIVFLFAADENDSTIELIDTGSVITVSFNAVVDADSKAEGIDAGAIAWNSFGYQYTVTSSGTAATAAPMEVGVQIPTAPVLRKELQTTSGSAAVAVSDQTFSYVIYPGESVETEWTSAEELIAVLKNAGIETYTIVEVSVPAGAAESEALSLKASTLTVYSTETGEPVADGSSWIWTENQPYTIVELPGDADYEFKSWNTTRTTNTYTFTYTDGATVTLTNANEGDIWEVILEKIEADEDGSYTVLDGAEFTLQNGDGAYFDGSEWVEKEAGENPPAIILGRLSLGALANGIYTLNEIKAPQGYNILAEQVQFTMEDGTVILPGDEEDGNVLVSSQSGVISIRVMNEKADYPVDIFKYYTGENGDKEALSGAEFVLTKTEEETVYYAKFTSDGEGIYTLTDWTETEDDAATLTSGSEGFIHINGLPEGTYALTETKAPDGYNRLDKAKLFVVSKDAANDEGTVMIEVENFSGSELPQAGGTGTLPFTLAGMLLVTSAAYFLYRNKKRNPSTM